MAEVKPTEVEGRKAEEKMAEGRKCASWFVLRDLKRPNAKQPAYMQLSDLAFEVFTPMREQVSVRGGRRVRRMAPYIPSLLFVRSSREILDPVVGSVPTLQYRFPKGGEYMMPMVVPDADMERFIRVVKATENPRYYLPEELPKSFCGREIRIVGGPLDGCEGKLLTIRGSKKRRLLVELPDFFYVGVEVSPEFIELL